MGGEVIRRNNCIGTMMLVFADDLTGAAEAGGIALHFGLSAEVQTGNCYETDADVLIADTNSRICTAEGAASRIRRRYEQYNGLSGRCPFKKVDSVLRGNVVAETAALLESTERERALLVPANPDLGRTVRDAQYWIADLPLNRTDFANDPEYPALTADIKNLLTSRTAGLFIQRWPLIVASLKDELPSKGIVVGEACTSEDLLEWADRVDSNTIPVGSAAFLDTFLQETGETRILNETRPCEFDTNAKTLIVCGSTSETSHQFCQNSEANGIPVIRIPVELLDNAICVPELIDKWVMTTLAALSGSSHVIVAIGGPVRRDPQLGQLLTELLSTTVEYVLKACRIGHILVEGGATAEALLRRLNWDRLRITAEIAPGVVSARVVQCPDLLITMKPGSYQWPEEVLK